MSQPLPQSNFKWLSREYINHIDFTTVPDNADYGYILEVDLNYPDHLHDSHSDYPLAPERRTVTIDMLSPFNKRLCDEYNMMPTKVEKLLTTLEDKKNYILHYRNLKFYLNSGLKLEKIHRVLMFRQCPWLAPFINFNTMKRKSAQNTFEKDFFKLMNNATYGKSLENVRSRVDFKLINNEKDLIKWTASPRLKNLFSFNKDLAGLTLMKSSTYLNKPVYVGLTVLDVSKLIMYEFHYNWAVRKYHENVQLCMTDTDSLLYNIKTSDVYEDIRVDLHLFDTSDYPASHPCYSVTNKKVLGKFKDEWNGTPLKELVGLRAKCYSLLDLNHMEKRVAKGVARVAIRTQLKHQHYRDCVFNHKTKLISASTIQSKHHNLLTQQFSKVALSAYDDKRYILEDGIRTLAYGHYSTRSKRQSDHDNSPPPKKQRTGMPTDLEILASMLSDSDSN